MQSQKNNSSQCLVSFTFDDGRIEQITKFYPVLSEFKLKGTFYVITERIGWRGVMNWEDLKILYKDGNEIGSHTHTHPHLTKISKEQIVYEYKKSKNELRFFNCNTLAFPYGEQNPQIIKETKKYFIAARGWTSQIENKKNFINILNENRYNLKIIPLENPIKSDIFSELRNNSLFGLSLANFQKVIKTILDFGIRKNAWIIFAIHGNYDTNLGSWFYKKPIKMIKTVISTSVTLDLLKKIVSKKKDLDRILKFRWMCRYILESNQIKVLPVNQVINKYY